MIEGLILSQTVQILYLRILKCQSATFHQWNGDSNISATWVCGCCGLSQVERVVCYPPPPPHTPTQCEVGVREKNVLIQVRGKVRVHTDFEKKVPYFFQDFSMNLLWLFHYFFFRKNNFLPNTFLWCFILLSQLKSQKYIAFNHQMYKYSHFRNDMISHQNVFIIRVLTV